MYLRAIIFYFILMSISLVVSSCCETIYTVTADYEVSFVDFEKEMLIDPITDTIRSAFIYSMDAEIIADNSHPMGAGFISTAYATSCSEEYVNGYQPETARLVLDKPFLLDGHVIEAGTDMLTLDEQFSVSDYNAQVYEYGIRVWFHTAFVERASFPLSNYTFIASVMMEDGTLVQSQASVIIDFP